VSAQRTLTNDGNSLLLGWGLGAAVVAAAAAAAGG